MTRRNRTATMTHVPLFPGFTHLYFQFEDFSTHGTMIPESVKKAMADVKLMSETNEKAHGTPRKAILVSLKIGRELYPYVKARVTPIEKGRNNEDSRKGQEYQTYWMP